MITHRGWLTFFLLPDEIEARASTSSEAVDAAGARISGWQRREASRLRAAYL